MSTPSYKYDSIPPSTPEIVQDDKDEESPSSNGRFARNKMKILGILGILAGWGMILMAFRLGASSSPPPLDPPPPPPLEPSVPKAPPAFPMPSGVNLGSWLSLEDYFFVGHGAVEVATPFGKTQGNCLPPLLQNGPRWNSETDLMGSLVEHSTATNASQAWTDALLVFHAHRTTFIERHDLESIASLGIQHVRVPVSWCLTDANPSDLTTTHTLPSVAVLKDRYTCADPYYPNVYWPAVPKTLLLDFLNVCSELGITATLDIHTYPGATSIGTFSGLWPQWSRFWLQDHPQNASTDLGRTIWRQWVAWIEAMAVEHPAAFAGLRGLTPMNEPAHLAGLFLPNDPLSFLPPLPPTLAQSLLKELNTDRVAIPDGPHLRVFKWLQDAVQVFRDSSLPALGKQLHVNIHESIFATALTPKDDETTAARLVAIWLTAWWSRITTTEERATWAALDLHHYHAWSPDCQGSVTGTHGNYSCSNVAERNATLTRCTAWANLVRDVMTQQTNDTTTQLVSAEFSASTHHLVRMACNDVDSLKATYLRQVQAAAQARVELYWWSWKMPYGNAFRPAWSFSHFLYLMGVTDRPDESVFDCGRPESHADDPQDGFF